jgi:dienelactone hydrolase
MGTTDSGVLCLSLLGLVFSAACSSGSGETPKSTQGTGGVDSGLGGGGQSPGGTGGVLGSGAGANGATGTGGTTGVDGSAGTVGSDGTGGVSGTDGGGTADGADAGACCPDGDCLCRGPAPTGSSSAKGPFTTATFGVARGTVHYPTDAGPPFASVAMGTHFSASGPEMGAWGSFYASHGIVTIIANASTADVPAVYAEKLLAAIEQLKAENTRSGSPLMGKLSDRYGISGHSIGGGGATLAAASAPMLKTSVGFAPWGGNGDGVRVPTLLLCGESDTTAPCSMSETVYVAVPESTPKMMVSITGATHFHWFDPTSADRGASGETALAFHKVFLEGDQRYKPFLLQSRGTTTTNIQ